KVSSVLIVKTLLTPINAETLPSVPVERFNEISKFQEMATGQIGQHGLVARLPVMLAYERGQEPTPRPDRFLDNCYDE
ncbi:hypothetical protein DPMN_189380, partial [Dreissena polymorpha]